MTAAQEIAAVELSIDGMTCTSCAHRIEKKLNKLDGVTATVNFATEKAHVEYGDGVTPDQLVATVGEAGYQARLPEVPVETAAEQDPIASLRQRLLISAVLTVPVIAMAMVPALQFTYWQWLSLALAAPVVVWGAWPFHRAALANLRHGSATMDTLISMGTLAALGWSVYALFWGTAGMPGMKHAFELTIARTDGTGNIYLEAAAGVTTFILAGRYFEARAKRRAGAALEALLELGAKDVSVLRDGVEQRIPIDQLTCWRRVHGASWREDRHRRRRGRRQFGGGCVDAHRRVGAGGCGARRPRWSARPSMSMAGLWCGPTALAPTHSWHRWRAWWRTRRTARPRHSGWRTGSPGCSCRSSSLCRWRRWGSGSGRVDRWRRHSRPRWRY